MRLQQREIGSDRERHQRHDRHEEQHADHRAAADPDRDLDVALEQGRERAHAARSSFNSRASSSPSGRWVAAIIMPPRCEMARIRSSSMACEAVSSAEVGSSSSQSGRFDRDQPRDREPALLPGGEIGRRQPGQRCRARPRPAPRAASAVAAEPCDPEGEIFRDRQRGFQGVAVAEIMRLLADAALGIAARKRQRAARDSQQACDHAQQRRLAGAVAAGHQQRLAALRPKNPSPSKIERPPRWQHQSLRRKDHRISHLCDAPAAARGATVRIASCAEAFGSYGRSPKKIL